MAAYENSKDIADLLIKSGADVNARDYDVSILAYDTIFGSIHFVIFLEP